MSQDPRRAAAGQTTSSTAAPPRPPPLPAPRPLQRARDAASRFLGYSPSRPPSPQGFRDDADRYTLGSSQFTRSSSLGTTQNATTSHKTGLEIHTISINESGSHAIIAGKEIFKTVKVEDGHCAEDFNLRTAIRSTPTQASGQPRQVYSIDIADVAWSKGAETPNYIAAATSSGKIIVYDLGHAGLQAAQLHEHFRQVHNVTFNPHRGSLLLSGSQDGTVRLWDVRDVRNSAHTVQSKRKFSGQSEGVRDVKWSPVEGYDFAFGTDNGEIQRWDMRNLKVAKVRVPAHGLACNTVDWHPDGKHILSASSDKTVRVFDVSTSRPRKASWEIKTPHPVMLARWRPSCQSAMPQDNGAQLCTQIVTAYDREHPMMHVWDFRRPHLPFRELQPHPSSPTDMLWHSQDLLWTVGKEGTFLQTDIQHSPKVIDRCNLQSIDVSPLNELTVVAQARHCRRTPRPQKVPSLQPNSSSSLSTSPESTFLSRSWADDSLDHSFLSVLPFSKRQTRSTSSSRVHNASGSSILNNNQSATIKLNDVLLNRKSFRPPQVACRGQLPSHNSTDVVAYIAERCSTNIPETSSDDGFLKEVEKAFTANEDYAQSIGFLQTAQTWKIVGVCTLNHLRERLSWKRKQALEAHPPSPTSKGAMNNSIESLAHRFAVQHLKSPTQSPGTMRPVSNIAAQLAVPESTSNVPTPLARPTTNGKAATTQLQHPPLPDPDKGEKIALPPSIASADITPPPRSPSEGPRLTVGNLEDLQRIETRNDSSDRNDMVKRWSHQPKAPLNLDPVDADGVKIPASKLENHGSGESFQFLEESGGSTDSSFPASLASTNSGAMQMVSAHPSRGKLQRQQTATSFPTSTQERDDFSAQQSTFFEGSGTLANSAFRAVENYGDISMETSNEDVSQSTKRNTDTTDFAFRVRYDSDTMQRRAAGSVNGAGAPQASIPVHAFGEDYVPSRKLHQDPQQKISSRAIENIMAYGEQVSPADSVIGEAEPDLELNKPWSLVEMLHQLLRHYTAEQPYPQMAALLLLLLGPLLPRTHPLPVAEVHSTISGYVDYLLNTLGWDAGDIPSVIQQSFEQPLSAGLQPLQVESILSTYHEQLLSYQLWQEAAVLRSLSYPAYPAVYEDFVKDNRVHLMCGQCKKPVTASTIHCENCRNQQRSCPVCWERSSPFGNSGKCLFSSCLFCGHGGHAACLDEWFGACHGQGCPTEGCLCDCTAGRWREERTAEMDARSKFQTHGRVKSDEWRARESKAVEGVRKLV
ncbi:WD repeat-containing 24 [Lecanosticta acicola]|uniref:WD repeat-containing 24 n=1 Tax=Lecanosticta acicola TaxID=111012 RepID=A0AAI8W189_9PEZI|nr:WD repeat-containing 24 [Lecanosticta acicola]